MEGHAPARREQRGTVAADVFPEVSGGATGDWPVVILSGGVTGLGVLRAFARQGIRAYVYPALHDDVVLRSRWFAPLPGTGVLEKSPAASVALLERILAESGLERACLCACGDDWNRVVAEYLERRGDRFVAVVPPLAALGTLQNKGQFALQLQRLGVPMPKTRLISCAGDIPELPETDETFFFLKPTDSQSFLERFGTKGLRVRTADDARLRLAEVTAAGMSVVLQEYIPGPFSDHYFIDGYVDRQGTIRALFPRRRLRIYPPDFGNSTSMVSVPLGDVQGAVDTLKLVLADVSYRGIFSAEFKRDARDGLYKLLEVNARPWWFIDFAVRCGVDVCRMAYDDALGRSVASLETYRVGATCIYPYYDFFAMRPLVRSGRAGWGRWVSELSGALQPIACWDDPMPGALGSTRVLFGALAHLVTRRRA
jgi:D-aspartate ligase